LIQNYRNVLNKGPEKLTQINVYCDYSLQKTVLLTFKIAWPCMIKIQQAAVIFNKGKTNEVRALYGLDLHIQKGEFVVVVGANGSGKSTLLNVIAGSQALSAGKILLNEDDVTKLKEYERSKYVARIFQNPLLGTAPELSVIDNFRLAALRTQKKLLKIGITPPFKNSVQEKLSTLGMGLENKLDQAMGSLSGGQRQALTLLMAIMDNAQILLMDEPTAALDPRSSTTLMQLADKIIREYHLTALLVTHTLKDAFHYGSRLIQMEEGIIIKDISKEEKQKLQSQELFGWFEN
jgi:putative ABC transport system ATP-binding protein